MTLGYRSLIICSLPAMDRSAAVDGPFMAAAPSANPQYSAAKMNSSSSSANNNNSKSIKPPKAPEKPLMPYMRYSRKVWDQVKAANKDSKLWEIGRIIGQMWRELPAEDKQEHINDYETEKEQYAESLKAYQNSPAYQQYLACKEKAAQAEQRQRDMEIVGTNGVLVGAKSKGGPFSDSQNLKVEQRLTIPQIDSDLDMFDTDAVSTRRLAALRYQRNQRLLHEVFNDSCVPDLRGVVTAPRMKILKRQIESLSMHQQKLEEELNELEVQFQEKKRRLESARDEFTKDWDKMCVGPVTTTTYDEMVKKATDQLAKDYEVYKASEEAKKAALMESSSLSEAQSDAQPEAPLDEDVARNEDPAPNDAPNDAPTDDQHDQHSSSNGLQNGLPAAESESESSEK